jgi:hypothetical protein
MWKNFSESIGMAGKRQRFQGNRPPGRAQVMDMGMVARSRRGGIESTSSAWLCARLSDPRSQMVSLQWLFGKILKIIHENATATLPALGIWSNGFMTSRASRPLGEGSFQSTTDLANRTESGVAAMPVLLDSGLH